MYSNNYSSFSKAFIKLLRDYSGILCSHHPPILGSVNSHLKKIARGSFSSVFAVRLQIEIIRNNMPRMSVLKHLKKGKEVMHIISACTLCGFALLLLYNAEESVSP